MEWHKQPLCVGGQWFGDNLFAIIQSHILLISDSRVFSNLLKKEHLS